MTSTPRTDGTYLFSRWESLAAVLLTLGGLLAWIQYQDYRRIDAEQRERLAAQAEVIEKNVVPQILLANRVIERIIRDLPAWQAERDGFKRATRELQVINDTLLGIRPILVIKSDGTVVASSNETLIGQNFAQREYFKTALKNPDPAILHVSAPFRTVLDTFVISLFRSIRGPKGEFAGIVIVSVVPEYFSSLLDSVRYASDMRTAIIHGDGRIFLTSPAEPGLAGKDVSSPASLVSRHLATGQAASVLAGRTQATGENRLVAHRTIRIAVPPMDKPLVIVAGRDLQSIFAVWRSDAYVQGGLFGALVLASGLGLGLYQRRLRSYSALVGQQEAERKQAETALRVSEERYRLVVEESPLGIVITQNGLAQYVNPALLEMIGYPDSAILEKSFFPFIHEEDQPWVKDLHLRRMRGEQVDMNYVVRMVRKGGEVRHWQMKTSNIEWGGKPAALGIVSDISDRIRMEVELREARDAAEAASLIKSRFLAAASHDLRQPMQAISLFADALNGTNLDPEQKRIRDYLAQSTQSLSDLLSVLLDISKLDAGVIKACPEVVAVGALASKIDAEFSPMAAEKSLRFKLSFPFRDMAVVTDGKLLMSLLGNLIGNAIKYTPQGGVLVAIRRRGNQALIQVWDTGIGVAAEHMSAIFEEYFQVGNPERDRAKGLGLGLAIAKRIAKLLETDVVCHSRPGRGSVFEFCLPLADAAAKQTPDRIEATDAAPGTSTSIAGRRIVVVEDEVMVARAIQLSLESLGASVIRYVSAEDALADDAIADAGFYVSGYRLPGLNGVEFLDAVRKRSTKPVRAVLLTGSILSDQVEIKQSSPWPVLLKPADLSSLLAAIELQDWMQ